MMTSRFLVSFSLLLMMSVSFHSNAFAQVKPGFPRTTFKAFEASHSLVKGKGSAAEVGVGFSTSVTFVGRVRPIPKWEMKALGQLKKLYPENQKVFNLYHDEVELSQGTKTYWIPVQRELLKQMKRESIRGQKITAYVRYFGYLMSHRIYLMIHFSHVERNGYL